MIKFAKIVRTLFVATVFYLSGCSSINDREVAWQAIHVMDVAQTYQIARSTCHPEVDPITRKIIGKHPSTGNVLAWGIASAIIYNYVDRIIPDTVLNMNFAFKVGAVQNNFEVGLQLEDYDCDTFR